MKIFFCVLILMVSSEFCGAERLSEFYGDSLWNYAFGSSMYTRYRQGIRNNNIDIFGQLELEAYDMGGVQMSFSSQDQRAKIGLGMRIWDKKKIFQAFGVASQISGGDYDGESDYRAGAVAYKLWKSNKKQSEIYAEMVYTSLVKDVFYNLRLRYGELFNMNGAEYAWIYGIGQLWAAGDSDYWSENRCEIGLGLSKTINFNWAINAEYRYGWALKNKDGDENGYSNPSIAIACYY